MGTLRDRGKRLKGKTQPTPKPAAKPPLVEERVTAPVSQKPLVVRPPPRKRPAVKEAPAEKPVEAPPVEKVVAAPPAEKLPPPPAPKSRDEATMPAKRVPKVVVDPQVPTEQLSVSDLELVGEGTATSRDPVDPISTPESVTVAARPAPTMEKPPERTAKFNAPGDACRLGIAGLKLQLTEVMGPDTVKVQLFGGKLNYSPVLTKGVEATLPSYELNDGKYVNVLLTYKGASIDGSALEVRCVVEGAATTLAQTISRATSAARDIVAGAPSSWRFLSNMVTMGAGIATIVASFTMAGMKTLGSFGQYGIAAVGVVALGLGFWSTIERMRYNDNVR